MPKTCNESADKLPRRIVIGGYVFRQRLDEVSMSHADILNDLMSLTGINASKEETYRIIARTIHKIHEANKALVEVKMLLDENGNGKE